MISTKVIVKTIDDTTPAVEDPHNFIGESGLESMVILEKGMTSGKTSVSFVVRLSDGKYTIAQTSATLFNSMASALKGAETRFENGPTEAPKSLEEIINAMIIQGKADTNQITDGYHTFKELYDHRIELFIALCSMIDRNEYSNYSVWRSLLHSDGELPFGGGWFVLGINREPGRQITYHLPIDYWEQTADFKTLKRAPEYDGHTSADVLNRIKAL